MVLRDDMVLLSISEPSGELKRFSKCDRALSSMLCEKKNVERKKKIGLYCLLNGFFDYL